MRDDITHQAKGRGKSLDNKPCAIWRVLFCFIVVEVVFWGWFFFFPFVQTTFALYGLPSAA